MCPERIRTCIAAEFEAGGLRAEGQIRNIGEGGLFVRTASVPEPGECVELSFRAPGGEVVSLSGMVWWTTQSAEDAGRRKPGFGIRLLEESEELRRLLGMQ